MKQLFTVKNGYIVLSLLIFLLLFYQIDIETDFFAYSAFTTFFIISRETVHDIVFYASVGIAGVLTIRLLSKILFKRYTGFSRIQKRIIRFIEEANQNLVLDTPALYTQEIINLSQVEGPQQKTIVQTTRKIASDPNVEKKITLSPNLFQEKEDKVFCSNCKKEVGIIRSGRNNSQKVGYEDLCPYCNKPLNSQSWLDTKLWGKCFKF